MMSPFELVGQGNVLAPIRLVEVSMLNRSSRNKKVSLGGVMSKDQSYDLKNFSGTCLWDK